MVMHSDRTGAKASDGLRTLTAGRAARSGGRASRLRGLWRHPAFFTLMAAVKAVPRIVWQPLETGMGSGQTPLKALFSDWQTSLSPTPGDLQQHDGGERLG